jgi:hypothetical protein
VLQSALQTIVDPVTRERLEATVVFFDGTISQVMTAVIEPSN